MLLIKQSIKITYLQKNIKLSTIKRTMGSAIRLAGHCIHKTTLVNPVLYSRSSLPQREMSYTFTYKPKTAGKEPFITDGGQGKHIQVASVYCDKSDCSQNKCPAPCTEIKEMVYDGHLTHTPPNDPTKKSFHISNTDAKGKNKDQYATRRLHKDTASPEDIKNLTEDDITPTRQNDTYMNSLKTTGQFYDKNDL